MSLYIETIPSRARKGDLIRVFQRFGRCNIQLRTNARFGFVNYDDPEDAERALKTLSGNLCEGLSTLRWSWPKAQQPRNRISSDGSNTRKENYANTNLSARGMDRYSRDDVTSGSFRGDHRKNHCLTRTDDSTADNRNILSRGRKHEKMKRIRESESPETYLAKKSMRPRSRSTSLSDKSMSTTRFASNSDVRSRSYSTSSSRSKSHSQRSRNPMSKSSSRPHTGSTSSAQHSAPSSELQSEENDCVTKATSLQQKGLNVSDADSKPQKIAKSMSMTSEEMLMISKHYGLEQPEGVDEDISAESFFGCGRLWPWEVVYYRRLKKGPITTKNYAQRLSQNKEFGIVDKYVRSSSGWGESIFETAVVGTCMLHRQTHGEYD